MWVSNLNSYGGVEEENDLLKVCLKEHQGRQGDSVMNSVLSADRKQVSTVSGKIFMPLFCWSPQILLLSVHPTCFQVSLNSWGISLLPFPMSHLQNLHESSHLLAFQAQTDFTKPKFVLFFSPFDRVPLSAVHSPS